MINVSDIMTRDLQPEVRLTDPYSVNANAIAFDMHRFCTFHFSCVYYRINPTPGS